MEPLKKKKGEKWRPGFVKVDPEEVDVVRWLHDGIVKVLIGSRIFDEAQNIVFLTDMINASGGKAHQRLRQKIGRVLRRSKGKGMAWFWDPWDRAHFYLTNHSRKRREVAEEEGYPIFDDPIFSLALCWTKLSDLSIKGSIQMKEKEIEIGLSLTVPLAAEQGLSFFVKPSVGIRATLEDGDDAEQCMEVLHHKGVCMLVREIYRQAQIAGHIKGVGIEQAKEDFLTQAKEVSGSYRMKYQQKEVHRSCSA